MSRYVPQKNTRDYSTSGTLELNKNAVALQRHGVKEKLNKLSSGGRRDSRNPGEIESADADAQEHVVGTFVSHWVEL